MSANIHTQGTLSIGNNTVNVEINSTSISIPFALGNFNGGNATFSVSTNTAMINCGGAQ